MHGHAAKIKFYVVEGDGLLLLGNQLIHKCDLLGEKGVLVIPAHTEGISTEELQLQTYTSRLIDDPKDVVRTRLLVVPCTQSSISSFFASYRCLRTSSKDLAKKFSDGKIAKRLASKLHGYTHMPVNDMKEICRRAQVLTPVLQQALQAAFDKCTGCKSSGRPSSSRKISFRRLLISLNTHVQLDFLFIRDMINSPILHIVDASTAFSATALTGSREMSAVVSAFEKIWINAHGAPEVVSGDPEFFNEEFRNLLRAHFIKFEPRPARRHNKLGIVESKNEVIKKVATRLLHDVKFFSANRQTPLSFPEILSKATFLSNIMYGGRQLSSFELVRGYTPSVLELPQSRVPVDLVHAYQEQMARRAIHTLQTTRNPQVPTATSFPRGTAVYYFKRGPKFGTWNIGYVQDSGKHSIKLSSNKDLRGGIIHAPYEDIRSVPKSPLLLELDEMGFRWPISHSIVEEDDGDCTQQDNAQQNQAQSNGHSKTSKSNKNALDFILNSSKGSENYSLTDEQALWSAHPCTRSLLVGEKPQVVEDPSIDIGRSFDPPRPDKDIGQTPVDAAPSQFALDSEEQTILKKAKEVLAAEHVSETRLQFLPRWIIDKAIQKERSVYNGCYKEVHRSSLPKDANVVTSHHFFHVKDDGEKGALRLKCRLVSHGNKNKDKDLVRKDSSSAQFPVIRVLLSLAALLSFPLATIDIKGAYLQGGHLTRDIYMIPPRGWSKRGVVWKILVPTYGLCESGRLWQLTIERWLFDNRFDTIPGLPQVFVLRRAIRRIKLALVKVVDDILLAGELEDVKAFHANLRSRFRVGKFELADHLIFNRLRVHRMQDGSIAANMVEYMDTIQPLKLTRDRRKEFNEKCTTHERTLFLALTGSLNFLGHGVLPQVAFAASYLQQRIGKLCVSDLMLANAVLLEIKQLAPKISYRRPCSLQFHPRYLAFSDASQGKTSYGQTGYLSGLYLQTGGEQPVYHVLDWSSSKQQRVSFSSIGAEILAAAASSDRGSMMSECLQNLYGSETELPFVLTVDSNGLYSTITTLHEGRDYRLRPTVARLRDSFESGEISALQWVSGTQNVADALTKRNVHMYRKLNSIMVSGILNDEILKNAKRVSDADERKI